MEKLAPGRNLVLAALALLLIASPASAQSGSDPSAVNESGYTLTWWTVDGGGTTSARDNGYLLGGTAGQPDAAVWSGGDYHLVGGFWVSAVVVHQNYLPLILKN